MNNSDLTDQTLQQVTDNTNSVLWRPIRSLEPIDTMPVQIAQLQAAVLPPAVPGTVQPKLVAGVPLQLLAISATQSPVKAQGRTFSEVSVTFVRDASDQTYAATRIFLRGYKGNTSMLLETEAQTSPVTFLLETTGEAVTIIGCPVGSDGTPAPIDLALSCVVTLNGVVQAPPGPTVTQSLVSTPTGFQFIFAELVLTPGTQDVIDSYKVYYNTVNNSATASVGYVYKHNPAGGSIVVQPQLAPGQTRYYWVSAVNTQGLESVLTYAGTNVSGAPAQGGAGSNLVFNGDFSIFTATTGTASTYESSARTSVNPDGWTQNFEDAGGLEGVAYQRAIGPLDGMPYPFGMVMSQPAANTQVQFSVVSDAFPVLPSAVYTFSAYLNTNLGVPTHGSFYFRVLWYQPGTTDFSRSSATFISLNDIIAGQQTSINGVTSKNLQAPSNAGFCRIAFYQWQVGGTTTTLWNLVVSAVKASLVTTSLTLNSTNNSFTWVDGSNNPLANILTQSGTSTTINVAAAHWRAGFGTILYNGGSVNPGSYGTWFIYSVDPGYNGGSPTISATSNFSDLTAQDWTIFYGQITTASGGGGSGGGGSGGGGDPTCFSGNTRLLSGQQIRDVNEGDFVCVANGDKIVTRRVARVLHRVYTGLVLDMGSDELVTLNHPIRCGKKWLPAKEVFSLLKTVDLVVYNLEIDTADPYEHNFILANGYIAHNGCTL